MNRLLFVDVETGGLNPKEHSLLSVGLAVWESGVIIDKVEYFVAEDKYNVTAKAMEINKLNLAEVYEKGISTEELSSEIHNFVKKHFTKESIFGKATLAGWNVAFDIAFLKELFVKNDREELFNSTFSYRNIDIAGIVAFYNLMNVFYSTQEIGSLDSAMKYFNLSCENRHSALGDVEVTIQVFNKLCELSNILGPICVRGFVPVSNMTKEEVSKICKKSAIMPLNAGEVVNMVSLEDVKRVGSLTTEDLKKIQEATIRLNLIGTRGL